MFTISNETPARILPDSLVRPLSAGALIALVASQAHAVPLSFDNAVGAPNGTNLLGATHNQSTMYFTGVATDNGTTIDARISATLFGNTNFAEQSDPTQENYFGDPGFIANYNGQPGGPEGDLGFVYYGNGVDDEVDGMSVEIEFFDGTDELSGTFSLGKTVSALELAVYDVDGEASQSEYFTAYKSDGLMSYALGETPQALFAAENGDGITFTGPGQNYSEADASGAALLMYGPTQSVTLDFESLQYDSPYQNAVFSAIDGDVSLFTGGEFGDPVDVAAVPVPMSAALLITGLAGLAAVRRRRSQS